MSNQSSKPMNRHVPARITEYLATGGLFNPELMDHQAVRDLLIDARDVIEILERERRQSETAAEPSVAVLSDAATEFARYQLHEAKGRLQLSAYDMLTCAFLKGVAFSMHGYKFVPPLPVKTGAES